MKYLKIILVLVVLVSLVAEDSEARRRRRRRGRSKLYSPPTKFEIRKTNSSFEIKKDKMILTHEHGRTEEPIPFQTKQDKVAGMSYIPLGDRHFIQMLVWVVDAKGNLGPGEHATAVDDEQKELLYWDLYEIVGEKIVWRQHQLLDQFIGNMDKSLPPHMENAIQLALNDSGKVYFRRGAIEQLIPE